MSQTLRRHLEKMSRDESANVTMTFHATRKEREAIDRLQSDNGFRTKGELIRTALEAYAGEQIFRPRTLGKYYNLDDMMENQTRTMTTTTDILCDRCANRIAFSEIVSFKGESANLTVECKKFSGYSRIVPRTRCPFYTEQSEECTGECSRCSAMDEWKEWEVK